MTTSRLDPQPRRATAVRALLRASPFTRGRGKLLGLARRAVLRRPFNLDLGSNLLVPADLDEFGVLWEFLYGPSHAWGLSWQLIRPGDIVVDVGANLGFWSLRAAARTDPTGSVHAFEPDPRNSSRLTHNAQLNALHSIVVVERALADTTGHATFHLANTGDSGKGRLQPRRGLTALLQVSVVTLDSYLAAERVPHVDFMKVDVEGGEEDVFLGAQRLLARADAPLILFEAADTLADSVGSSTTRVKMVLMQLGYRIFRPTDSGFLEIEARTPHQQDDLFAVKSRHLERLHWATRSEPAFAKIAAALCPNS